MKEEDNSPISESKPQEVTAATIGKKESKTVEEDGHEKMQENDNVEHQQTKFFDIESCSDIEPVSCSPSFGLNGDYFLVLSFENELDKEQNAAEKDVASMHLDASFADVKNDERKSDENLENEILPVDNMLFNSETNFDEDDSIIADIELEDLKFSGYDIKKNEIGNINNVEQQGSNGLPVLEETLKTLMYQPF